MKIRFGEKTIVIDEELSVRDIIKNEGFKMVLGFGDNVEAYVGGGVVEDVDETFDGDVEVILSTVACNKG